VATFNENTSGGASAAGSALNSQNIAAANTPMGGGGLYGAGTGGFSGAQGSLRTAFVARFSKGGAAFIRTPEGGRNKVRILEYVTNIWGDGRYETDGHVDLIYNGSDLNATEYLTSLNIINDIGTRDLYYRYLNSVS
jgi:hypothetical protein